MKCIVKWIPFRIYVRSRNTLPYLKGMVGYFISAIAELIRRRDVMMSVTIAASEYDSISKSPVISRLDPGNEMDVSYMLLYILNIKM